MSKKNDQIRIGSLKDSEVFEIDLTRMSTAFMAAYLSRQDVRFLTMKEEDQKALACQSLILAHELMIHIQECVEKYGE